MRNPVTENSFPEGVVAEMTFRMYHFSFFHRLFFIFENGVPRSELAGFKDLPDSSFKPFQVLASSSLLIPERTDLGL